MLEMQIVELIVVTLIVKLIVMQWYPPIQRSLQGILCIVIGSGIGAYMNPTKEGVITAIIASGFAFYGGELIQAFKGVAKDAEEIDDIILSRIKK
ncbi:hypothetical protein [Romboutsia sp.]|uniref:hypothetical protein n=1 Tax=Romboutsia sp. TaxID=1965302 RepID=UPI002B6819DF|nr:hypothetical protein [Romboutsia sp.]HSQ87508.1 hypothetical protein [Romboutsia sp.]